MLHITINLHNAQPIARQAPMRLMDCGCRKHVSTLADQRVSGMMACFKVLKQQFPQIFVVPRDGRQSDQIGGHMVGSS